MGQLQECIDDLGSLVPELAGKIEEDDYQRIKGLHAYFKPRPAFLPSDFAILTQHIKALNYFLQTSELYKTNEGSRKMLELAIGTLERIAQSEGGAKI